MVPALAVVKLLIFFFSYKLCDRLRTTYTKSHNKRPILTAVFQVPAIPYNFVCADHQRRSLITLAYTIMKYLPAQRLTLLLLPVLLASCGSAVHVARTSKKSNLAVTTAMYRGTIFTKDYSGTGAFLSADSTQRFTPGEADIRQAEKILRLRIKAANKLRTNQPDGSPLIHQNLNCYYRQYLGFIAPSGERIVHVNLYWDKYSRRNKVKGMPDKRLKFEDEYAMTQDGGSYYWKVNVNLTTAELSDFRVNRTTIASAPFKSSSTAALTNRPD